jgi:hypothetical protein
MAYKLYYIVLVYLWYLFNYNKFTYDQAGWVGGWTGESATFSVYSFCFSYEVRKDCCPKMI